MADGLRSQLRPGLDRAVARVELRLDRDRYAAWGQMGTGPGQLQSPWSVFSSLADEGCYVVDTYNNRVQRFGPGGRPIPFGPDGQRKGSDLGEFDFPTGGCVDFDGNLWVADQGNRRLQQFTPTGELIGISGWHGAGAGSVKGPCDVACDPAGSHYVVDREAHKVFRGRGTAITAEWGGQGREPGKLETPCGIAIRHGAYVYVSDSGNNRIQKFTAEGELVDCWGGLGSAPGRFRAPHGIALDGDENVFVADSENHRIQQFTSTGELVRRWGAGGGDGTSGSGQGQFIQPRGVSVDGVGNVYVCEFGSSRIQRFGRDYVAAL
jgi:sugar lactone lactonase YvrE